MRFLLALCITVGILSGCAGYKDVSDPSDGANGKTKSRPVSR